MSHGFHQGLLSFHDGLDSGDHDHVAQQRRRDNGGAAEVHPALVASIEDETSIYDSAAVGAAAAAAAAAAGGHMLSDLFNFLQPPGLAAPMDFHIIPSRSVAMGAAVEWYGANRHPHDLQQHSVAGLSTDSSAAMQFFLMNPTEIQPSTQQIRSSSSPPHVTAFHHQPFTESSLFSAGRVVEGQGLSLSLSSSLQHLETMQAKAADELRAREGILYFNNNQHLQDQQLHAAAFGGGSAGIVNALRSSKYAKATQELLEEFCSVGREQTKQANKLAKRGSSSNSHRNPSSIGSSGGASTSAAASVGSPALSPAERSELQRKETKLDSMLDEVDRRHSRYCEQMQMVANSFDSVMGFGAATPYTTLAQRAMSRHFRCLRDAIAAQLKQTRDAAAGSSGGSASITKGATPRLRLLDQTLRQQGAFSQLSMMEPVAWRPQRGLPERSVNIFRGWLFEHFLHPYPSDADKHLLARQTGLSRNQVTNWFINARVRLWKPMVEEMYLQESKMEEEEEEEEAVPPPEEDMNQPTHSQTMSSVNPPPESGDGASASTPWRGSSIPPSSETGRHPAALTGDDEAFEVHRFAAGDVSLTLGLRHAGSGGGISSEKSRFSVKDFSDC